MARILEDELTADPLLRDYAGMNDAELLTSLNTADRTRNRIRMTGREVKAAVDATEYKALTPEKKQQMIELVKRDDLDLFGLDKDIFIDIFGNSTTGENLVAARVESISRAAELGLPAIDARYLRMHTLSRKAAR